MRFQREKLLIGEDNLNKLKNSHVIVFGLGGVGGYAVEALARAGVGELTLVDFDTVDITNINRQIIATDKTVGQEKAKLFKERVLSINPEIKVHAFVEKFTRETAPQFFEETEYDYVVDAIDIVTSKLDLIEIATQKKIPIIASMGMGNKIDPTLIQIADLYKTSVCPLAKVMRRELKNRGIKKLKVVFSTELPIKPENETGDRAKMFNVGSISFVPSVAGLMMASQVIKDICGLKSMGGC